MKPFKRPRHWDNRTKRKRKPREIAPRLLSGECRLACGHGLPPAIKAGIFAIARAENRSASWVMERVLIDYFDLKTPDYKPRKDDR